MMYHYAPPPSLKSIRELKAQWDAHWKWHNGRWYTRAEVISLVDPEPVK